MTTAMADTEPSHSPCPAQVHMDPHTHCPLLLPNLVHAGHQVPCTCQGTLALQAIRVPLWIRLLVTCEPSSSREAKMPVSETEVCLVDKEFKVMAPQLIKGTAKVM